MVVQLEEMGTSVNGMKYVSLLTLTLQNAVAVVSIRYYRSRPGDTAIASTVVLGTEILKLVLSLFLSYKDESSLRSWLLTMKTHIWTHPLDTLRVSVPAFVFLVQNTLLYIAASHLDAAIFHVFYQSKIFTTAMFSVLILKRKLRFEQWLSFVFLLVGIVLVQLASTEGGGGHLNPEENRLIGFSAAFGAALCSGFAGVYLEKIMKESQVSIWVRNAQLALLSVVIGLASCLAGTDSDLVWKKGFFFGYDSYILYLITLQGSGGLLVALVVKYADNLLKGFALSLAIVFSALISTILFNFQLTWEFVLGTFLVSISIFMYGCQPPAWLSSKVKLNFARSNSYKRKSSPRPAEKAPIVEQE